MMMVCSLMQRTLAYGGQVWAIKTGPYGRGALPTGRYIIDWTNVVPPGADGWTGPPGMALFGFGFFVPIRHESDTTRDGLGIHPDGGVVGTKGCIGLQGILDSVTFWTSVAMAANRPTTLEVI